MTNCWNCNKIIRIGNPIEALFHNTPKSIKTFLTSKYFDFEMTK